MKKLRVLVLLMAVGMAFVSCEKDDDSASSVSGNKYESTYAKMVMTGTLNLTVELKSKAELEENEMYSIIEFKADGKFYVDSDLEGTWTQSGSTVSVVSDGETVTASVSGDKVIMKDSETDESGSYSYEFHYTKM